MKGDIVRYRFIDSMSWFNWFFWGGSVLVSAILGALYIYQENLLYHPSIPGLPKKPRDNPRYFRSPAEYNIPFEELDIETIDGIQVRAWLLKQKDSRTRPTVIFFHGNAGNIGLRLPIAVEMYRNVLVNVLLVDYRGYGDSTGVPSENGLKLDANACLEAIERHQELDSSKIVVFGQSLGGAVSLHLASSFPNRIKGVILENTFLSISSMVDVLMPYLRYVKRLVLRMNWNSEKAIQNYDGPLLLIAGDRDELVPTFHMRTLFNLARSSSKELFVVKGGTHNDTWEKGGSSYYEKMRQFIDAIFNTETKGDIHCIDNKEARKDQIPVIKTGTDLVLGAINLG